MRTLLLALPRPAKEDLIGLTGLGGLGAGLYLLAGLGVALVAVGVLLILTAAALAAARS